MKPQPRILLQALLALPALSMAQTGGPAGAGGVTTGRIDQVLVYPGGATVERVVPVKGGTQQLRIACLPARFDADSLQIQAEAGVSLGEITVQTLDRVAAPECALSPLDAQIRELEAQRAAVAAESGALELSLGFMRNYTNTTPSAPIAATAETLRRSGLEALQRQNQLQLRKDEIERQIAPLAAERERQQQANPQLRTVLVRLSAPRDTELRLSYRLNQAGWEPVYRAHLDTTSGQLRLERHAQVAQNSGEDWREVRLRLSTAQPRQASGMPAPNAWLLDLLPPVSELQRGAAPAAFAAAPAPVQKMMSVTGSRAARDEALDFNVTVFQGEFATEFQVPGKVNVAANGQRIALALGNVQLEGRLMARAQPRVEPQAYLVVESTRPAGVWPAGALQLYRDGAYVGQSRLAFGSGEKVDLFFGRDELVRVTAEPEQRNAANTGFIGPRAEQRYGRVYRIENQHQRPFAIQVLESAPVARHEDIKVQAQFDPKPATDSWRKQPGIAAWEFTLAPGAAQRLSADYLISHPKDARISGLR